MSIVGASGAYFWKRFFFSESRCNNENQKESKAVVFCFYFKLKREVKNKLNEIIGEIWRFK